MTSIIRMLPFSGVFGESPSCYLLQIDEFRFLLDCGWDEKFNMNIIKEMKKHIHQIDAVLLSHPDCLHLGALPYLVGKCGLSCPVYATVPIYKMGQMFLYDLFQSHHNSHDFDVFTLDDIDAAFDKMMQLKYSQTINLKGRGQGLQITPLPAGHMIGGTVWKIVKDGEEEIIYAVDYNHKKERHLNGCTLDTVSKPSLLITDAFNATYVQTRRKNRDEQLLTSIINTMRKDGDVLIAVDTAGRVLELAQLLDTMWKTPEAMLSAYSLALLNNVSFNVVEFAKSQVEWMSDKIMRAFEDNRFNPFQFKHLKLCHNLSELNKVPSPKVVLASVADLECGFSRELFLSWCTSEQNSIILTSRTSPGTLARYLIDNPTCKSVTLEVYRRVKLEGDELEEYLKEKHKKDEELNKVKQHDRMADDSGSSESEAEENEAASFTNAAKGKHDLIMKTEAKKARFFKQNKKSFPMFPFHEDKIRWDDYGEIINPEDYMITEAKQADGSSGMEMEVDDEMYRDVSEVPTKCVSKTVNVEIAATIQFIDFEGRCDGESMKRIITQIKPRQILLVRGTSESTLALADYIRTSLSIPHERVLTPNILEVANCTIDSQIYQVRLRDSLVSSLQFIKTRDYELTWVDARVNLFTRETKSGDESDQPINSHESTDETFEDKAIPTLDILPSHMIKEHAAVFINEPKLSDFKSVLIKEGFQAEFIGGVLICNNIIAVKKNEAGRIQLEGCISSDYFKIRNLLYSQYAVI